MFVLLLTSFLLFVSFIAALLSLQCKGTHEYVLEPLPRLLARVTAGVRECRGTSGLFCSVESALVAGECGVIAGLEPVVRVENFLLATL